MEQGETVTTNQSSDRPPTITPRDHYFLDTAVSNYVRMPVVTLVGVAIVVSNMFNVLILRKMHMPVSARMYLVNLGLADLIVGVVTCLPCIAVVGLGFWPYGEIWCQVSGVITGTSQSVSIFNLALVGLDRYVAIAKPLKHASIVTKTRCRVLLATLWVLMVACYTLPLFLVDDYLYYKFNTAEGMCGLYWGFPLFCVLTGIIPISSGCIVTFTTFSVLRKLNVVDSNLGNHTSASKAKRDRKALVILITNTTLYFLFWGPYVISVITTSFFPDIVAPPVAQFIFMWVANSNSFINVIVYSSVYTSFRKEVKRLITPSCWRENLDHQGSVYVIGERSY